MRDVLDWDEYFMIRAAAAALRSKDPSTQVGCLLVDYDEKTVLASGYNGMPPGSTETAETWAKPEKYRRVVHAELNAVARAARTGARVQGATVYVTHSPCLECVKVLAAIGAHRVVFGPPPSSGLADWDAVKALLTEYGIFYEMAPRPILTFGYEEG